MLLYVLLLVTAAVWTRAMVKIMQGNNIPIEFDKPLTITCTNVKSNYVEFRHQQQVVANCFGTHGCNIDDERFNIMQNTSAKWNAYILTSNGSIKTDLCGVYECCDLVNQEKTHLMYRLENTTLKPLDETRMGHSMTPFNSKSVCSDKCGTLSAHNFTFGLNITNQEQGSTDVFIEIKIFHPDYRNKPLTWWSSNTFRVKVISPETPTSAVLLTVIVLVTVCVTVLIGCAILVRFMRQRSTFENIRENTANQDDEVMLHQDERKQIQFVIPNWIISQKKRSINTEKSVNTARQEVHLSNYFEKNTHQLRSKLTHIHSETAIASREKEPSASRHVETQTVGGGHLPV